MANARQDECYGLMTPPGPVADADLRLSEVNSRIRKLENWLAARVTGFGLLLVAVFLVSSAVRDVRRPIWYDEIFSREISRLSPRTIWLALSQSVDNQPFPFYLITHYSQQLFGDTLFALRFPQTLGFACMGVCIYLFLRRRVQPLCALATAILPLSTRIGYYATEGRPYGFVLGFCGLILVCWQAAAERRNRIWALPGLALSVAGAVSSHYFAVLILVPIGMAELVRSYQNRRLDVGVSVAIMSGLAILLAFLPHIAATQIYKDRFWAKPSLDGLTESFQLSLPIIFIAAASLIIAAFAESHARDRAGRAPSSFPLHEGVAAAGLFLLPLIALGAASFTGVFFYRYVLATVVGSAILCGIGVDWVSLRVRAGGILFVVCMVCLFGGWSFSRLAPWRMDPHPPLPALFRSAAQSPLPVVATYANVFLETYYRGDPSLNSHFWCLADPAEARRVGFQTTGDIGIVRLGAWVKLPLINFADLVARYPSFELVVSQGTIGRLRDFRMRGARIQYEASGDDLLLFHVEMNPR